VKRIQLSDYSYALCSDEDFDYLDQFLWCLNHGYVELSNQHVSMHSLIAKRMGLVLKDDQTIDHKDQNKKNNQRDNLRPATQQEQNCNRSKRSGQTSKYKGVRWHPIKKKWLVEIRVGNDEKVHLGVFDNEEEAARIYDRSAKRNFGEFAVFNFPEEQCSVAK